MAGYKPVVATRVSSSDLSEFSMACQRCGRRLKGKGSRGNALGHILCKDCGSDKTWQMIAAGKQSFDDLTFEAAS